MQIASDAPKDVEITAFTTEDSILINTVLLNTDYKARKLENFKISVRCDKVPQMGITITNTSSTEPIVMLKQFAENPELKIG